MHFPLFFLLSALCLIFSVIGTLDIANICPNDTFRCANGNCVMNGWVCDTEDDCGDKSDELNCDERSCHSRKYRCRNGHCIPHIWVCDDDQDCNDGTDELNCDRICLRTFYQCGNGHCIQRSWVCDGEKDCTDNSDELNCGEYASRVNVSQAPLVTFPEGVQSSTLTIKDTDPSTLTTEEESELHTSTVPFCVADYCQNGGSCEIVDKIRICRCTVGYRGETCQIKAEALRSNVAQNPVIVISISIVALVFAILSITMCLYPKKMASIHTRAREFVIAFHQPQKMGSNKKLTNCEDGDN